MKSIEAIASAFGLAEITGITELSGGHINTTYKILAEGPDGPGAFVAQKVNPSVFRDPSAVMENIEKVTSHIEKRGGVTLHFLRTKDGDLLFDDEGSPWRVCGYIESDTRLTCESLEIARAAGKAFGQFQSMLSDLDGRLLKETIPDFHNTAKRFEKLENDVARRGERASRVIPEFGALMELKSAACSLKDLPVRVTHNDMKLSNVLFKKGSTEPVCLIDLDTVMPGFSAWDIGDAARSICCTAKEDEIDLSKVTFDEKRFEVLVTGYFEGFGESLPSPEEAGSIASGALAMTTELAVRFLDDYVCGDTYFRTARSDHNLDRARCQLALALDVSKKIKTLETIASRAYDVCKAAR